MKLLGKNSKIHIETHTHSQKWCYPDQNEQKQEVLFYLTEKQDGIGIKLTQTNRP